jgi:hypothetical protein
VTKGPRDLAQICHPECKTHEGTRERAKQGRGGSKGVRERGRGWRERGSASEGGTRLTREKGAGVGAGPGMRERAGVREGVMTCHMPGLALQSF